MQTMDLIATRPIVEYDIYSPYQYPWMSFNLLLFFWVAAWICYATHRALPVIFTRQFAIQLDETKRRNVVTYILQLVATTVALAFQIYGGIDLLFRGQDTTTPERVEACIVSLTIICSLYVWEMIYRIEIGWPLLTHHIITILLIQIGYSSFFDTGNLWYFRYGTLLCFYAQTEQLTFIALYCYRMEYLKAHQTLLFQLAALQAGGTKTIVTTALLFYYARGVQEGILTGSWGLFWKITFPPLLLLLYAVQLYAAYILVTIGRRCHQSSSMADGAPVLEDEGASLPKVMENQEDETTDHSLGRLRDTGTQSNDTNDDSFCADIKGGLSA